MKHHWQELAFAGGTAAFDAPLHVGRPNIGNTELVLDRIRGALERRWLSNNGPLVQEFENAAAHYLGVKHFIAMCNGTVALEIAIRALGLTGEVLIPSFTFIATAHALQWQEITPVFCDIDPQTHLLDPGRLEASITPRTSGIVGVHLWGRPCAIEQLTEIAQRRNLKLLFDASHAFACSHKGRKIGNFGDAEVFSFHATKFFNTFEGGAIVTNNDELAQRIRLMKNFGFAGYDNVTYIGTNGKMTEVCAAMGLTGLESLDEFVAVNRRNHSIYRRELSGIDGLRLLCYDDSEACNYQYIVCETPPDISRDFILDVLHADNILARRYFYPGCHRMQPYRSLFPHAGLLLPATESLCERILVLPTGTAVSEENILQISTILRLAIEHASELQAARASRNH